MTTKTLRLALPILALLGTVACGPSDSGSGAEPTAGTEEDDETNEEMEGFEEEVEEDVDVCDSREPQDVVFDQVFWSAGFKVTFDGGAYLAATPDCPSTALLLNSIFENRGGEAAFGTRVLLNSGGVDHQGRIESPLVPGQRIGKGYISFESAAGFDLADATLLVGDTGEHLAQIPLGEDSTEHAITLEPQLLELAEDEFESDDLHFKVTAASARADTARWHDNLDDDTVQIRLWIDVTSKGSQSLTSTRYFFLELPDGSSVGVSSAGDTQLLAANETMRDLYMTFDVNYPAEGTYVLSAKAHSSADVPGEFEFEVPTLPYGIE